MTRIHRLAAVLIVSLCLCPSNLVSMVFWSGKVAAHWDTWCYFHNGTYYLYYRLLSQKCNGSRSPLNASGCGLTGV